MRPAGSFPQLFHADAVGHGIAVAVELEAPDELLGERAARALGQDQYLRLQVVAGLEIRLGLVLLVHALVVGAHAGDACRLRAAARCRQSR